LLSTAHGNSIHFYSSSCTKDISKRVAKAAKRRGDVTGRLILGETLDAVSPIVEVSKANISAVYDPIPFPLAIRGGRLSYDHRLVRMDDMQGSVGRSTVRGLDLTLQPDKSRQIRIAAKGGSLDLQQMGGVLRSFKNLRSPLDQLQSVDGQIELDNSTLSGVYDDPAGWTFASTGTFERVELRHADLPDRIVLARGRFDANQGKIKFFDTAAAISDASYVGGGSFDYDKTGPLRFETNGVGAIGAQMTRWLSRYVKLPDELQLRSPLNVAAERLAWGVGGDVSFHGQVSLEGGPLLAIDVTKPSQGLTLRNLSVEDGSRHARITFQLAKDNLDMSFSGELTQETVDKVFRLSMKGSSLRGDIRLGAALVRPLRSQPEATRQQESGASLQERRRR
jgi:hypothetical protein